MVQFPFEETWDQILELISNGESLSAVTRMPSMPSMTWCRKALAADADLRHAYHLACEARADVLGDAIVELADQPFPDDLDPAARSAWVNRQRLRIDARKWVSSKLKPRSWGDRLAIDAPAVTVDIRLLLAQREEQMQRYLLVDDTAPLALART